LRRQGRALLLLLLLQQQQLRSRQQQWVLLHQLLGCVLVHHQVRNFCGLTFVFLCISCTP
jgi:hypothetical protein